MKFTRTTSPSGYYHQLLLINLTKEELDDVMSKLGLDKKQEEKVLRAHCIAREKLEEVK